METIVQVRPLTFRVENILPCTTSEKLRKLFYTEDQPQIEVKSIAPAVDNDVLDTRELTATVTFQAPSPTTTFPRTIDESISIDGDFYGFTPLYHPPGHVAADVIAVTGLAAHAFGSWAHSARSMWLRDYLPRDVNNVRILIYGYPSKLQGNSARSILADHSSNLIHRLLTMRESAKCQDRPVIFIGHSLGCLIIKKVLCDINGSIGIYSSRLPVRSVIFLGAPHKGLHIKALQTLVEHQPSEDIIRELRTESPTLTELNDKFRYVAKDIDILTCYELVPTRTAIEMPDKSWQRDGPTEMMVPLDSARLWYPREQPVACNADHSQIARLKRGESGIYPSVKWAIQQALLTAANLYNETQREHPERTVLLTQEKEQPEHGSWDNCQISALVADPSKSLWAGQARPHSEDGLDHNTERPFASNNDTDKGRSIVSRSPYSHLDRAVIQRLESGVENLRNENTHSNSNRSIGSKTDVDMSLSHSLDSAAKSLWTTSSNDPEVERSLPTNTSCQSTLEVHKSEPQEARLDDLASPGASETLSKSSELAQQDYSSINASIPGQDKAIQISTTTANSSFYGGELKAAILLLDEQKTRDLLKHNFDINCKDDVGRTPLLDAVMHKHEHIVKILLHLGAYPGATDESGDTILHLLSLTSKAPLTESLMDLLLQIGPPVDTTNSIGVTPLMQAAKSGSLQVVSKLIRHGANVQAVERLGRTALHFSTIVDKWDVERLGHYVDEETVTAEKLPWFLEGLLEIDLLLIKQGAIIDARDGEGSTPLHYAARFCKRSTDRTECLLEAGANKEAQDNDGVTPLAVAVLFNNEACVTHLLKCGANLEARDKRGRTPLHMSRSDIDNGASFAHLLNHGANIEARDGYGETPVMEACWIGSHAGLAQLLRYGANVEDRSEVRHSTPLMLAARGSKSGHAECVSQLLRHGANIEAKDSKIGTALHEAAGRGNVEAVKILLGHGANPYARRCKPFLGKGSKPRARGARWNPSSNVQEEITTLLKDAQQAWKRAGKKTFEWS